MKKYVLLLIFLFISCSNNNKIQSDDKKIKIIPSINNCNHTKYYEYCDDLDTALFHYDKIEILSIYNKEYSVFPVEIIKLKKLKNLSISNQNRIEWGDLFNKISKLDSLKILKIKYCNIQTLRNINLLKNLTELTILDSSSNKFPIEITNLKSLKTLFYLGNASKLPKEFKNFENLKELSLNCQNISVFPLEVLSLRKLEILNLYKCKISVLPYNLSNLICLRELWLHGTPIGERELKYYWHYHDYNELKFIKNKLPNCEIILDPYYRKELNEIYKTPIKSK